MEKERSLKVTLITGRTIEQGVAKERGKQSQEYLDSVSVCFLNSKDMKKLGIKENTNVTVSTCHGSVVLRATTSSRSPYEGTIFIPYGLWANAIVDPETESLGMPSLKGIPAEVMSASEKPVLSLEKLLNESFRKKQHESH